MEEICKKMKKIVQSMSRSVSWPVKRCFFLKKEQIIKANQIIHLKKYLSDFFNYKETEYWRMV